MYVCMYVCTHDMYAHAGAPASVRKSPPGFHLLLLQHGKLPEFTLLRNVEVLDLIVQRQHLDIALHSLPALRAHPHDFESSLVDLLREMVDSHVGRGRHENLALVHLGEVIHDARRSNCLARPRRALHRQNKGKNQRRKSANFAAKGLGPLRQNIERQNPDWPKP